jgi:hypothetical protein
MRRIDVTTPLHPHFVGAWHLPDPGLCDRIVEFFESHPELQRVGQYASGHNPEFKNSVDINVNPRDLELPSHAAIAEYMRELNALYRDYLAMWPFLGTFLREVDIGDFNIQRYKPGGHFALEHSERTGMAGLHRVLVFMTYLNDVEAGGCTHFTHYGLDIKPERGKTLIWPAEWTHSHTGNVVEAGVKYIITGWMHFPLRSPVPRT